MRVHFKIELSSPFLFLVTMISKVELICKELDSLIIKVCESHFLEVSKFAFFGDICHSLKEIKSTEVFRVTKESRGESWYCNRFALKVVCKGETRSDTSTKKISFVVVVLIYSMMK